MKAFDRSRFENAFEQPPQEFHLTVQKALRQAQSPAKSICSRRRVAALVVAALVCLLGVAAAIYYGATLDDFLKLDLKKHGVASSTQFTVTGDIPLLDVQVREAASDGLSLYLTVEYALKESADSALVFGGDMDYVMDPERAYQALSNQLDIPAVKSYKNIYWLTEGEFLCMDDQGQAHHAWRTRTLYQSPVKVSVMYWFDLRTTDSFDSFIEPGTFAFPNALTVSISPELYLYQKGASPTVQDNPYPHICMSDYVRKAEGKLSITVSPERRYEVKRYSIAGFPAEVPGLRTVSATITETPVLYCVRLDFKYAEGQLPADYRMDIELLDGDGNPMEYLSYMDRARRPVNGTGDVDLRLELVCPKQDGKTPSALEIVPDASAIVTEPIILDWMPAPIE